MKKFLIVIINIIFLSACSSSGGNTNGGAPDFDGDPGFTNPDATPEHPVEEDKGYAIVDDQIFLDGQLLGTVEGGFEGDGPKNVISGDGETIAIIQNEYSGIWTVYLVDPNNPAMGGGDIYKIDTRDGEIKVDWANSTIDGRYGVEPPASPEPMLMTTKTPLLKGDIKRNIRARMNTKR